MYHGGNYARFYINGAQVTGPNNRGLNFVLVDPTSLSVVNTASFDTHSGGVHTTNMLNWLSGLNTGQRLTRSAQPPTASIAPCI